MTSYCGPVYSLMLKQTLQRDHSNEADYTFIIKGI
jgi:hypothetical protein